MQIAFPRGMNLHFAEIEEVKLSPERALGTAGTFGDGLYDSVLVRAPVHDHARLGERRASNQCAACFQRGMDSFLKEDQPIPIHGER